MSHSIHTLSNRMRGLLTVLVGFSMVAQLHSAPDDIDFNLAPQPQHAYVIAVGVAFYEQIAILNAPGPVYWGYTNTPSPESNNVFTHMGITVTLPFDPDGDPVAPGAQATLSGTPASSGSFTFTIAVTFNATTISRQYEVVIRGPVDMAIVLDRSGSMAWGYNGATSPPAGSRRWDGLITGIDVLSDSLSVTTLFAQDRIALRYFAGSVITPAAPFNGGMIPMMTNLPALAGNVAGQGPSGATALGAGILSARDALLASNPTSRKVMIVFSDGVQNTGDQVRTTGAGAFKVTNSGQALAGPADEIDIYTICLGSSGHNPALMQSIASNNGGQSMNTTAGAEADFQLYFTSQLINIFSGATPQYVDIRQGSMPAVSGSASALSETFQVNRGVSSVTIYLLAPMRTEMRITGITKDGVNIVQQVRQRRGQGVLALHARLPISGISDLGGEWTVSALGDARGTAQSYKMLIVVDDHAADFAYDIGSMQHKVSDPLHLSVNAQWLSRAIPDATVQAIVLKPGDDINDLLATANVDVSPAPDDPGTPDISKLAILMQDPAFVAKIKAQDQLLTLSYSAADSSYKGDFNGLDVSGVYQVVFRFSASNTEYGRIERTHHRSFNVRFENIDLAASGLQLSVNEKGITVLTIRPRATNGRFIGPGWGSVIGLTATSAEIQNIIDRGDGSYEIEIAGSLSGNGAISLLDEEIFSGNLADLLCYNPGAGLIQRIQCWLISMGLPGWTLWILILLLLILIAMLFRKKKP